MSSATSVTDRAIGSIVGCLVADAACVSIHWIYDVKKFNSILSQYPSPEFLETSYCPFYTVPVGYNSCYGDQMVALMKSLVECKGFNKQNYKMWLEAIFGPGSDYDINARLGRPATQEDRPYNGPWTNGSIKMFLENFTKGKEKTGMNPNSYADGFSKIAALVALYAGDERLLSVVEEVVRVTQDDDTAVEFAKTAALILEQYVLHGRVPDVLDRIQPRLDNKTLTCIKAVSDLVGKPHIDAVQLYGLSCSLPGCFQGALHGVLSSSDDYVASVRPVIAAPGDNCARASFVGACVGACVGLEGIPSQWLEKMFNKDIVNVATKIAKLRELNSGI